MPTSRKPEVGSELYVGIYYYQISTHKFRPKNIMSFILQYSVCLEIYMLLYVLCVQEVVTHFLLLVTI